LNRLRVTPLEFSFECFGKAWVQRIRTAGQWRAGGGRAGGEPPLPKIVGDKPSRLVNLVDLGADGR
jgi:hypothetical protein